MWKIVHKMFCNMQIFLDNLKIFLPKRRFIKTLTLLWWFMWLYVSNYMSVHRTNLHERRTMDPLSNYCKLTLHDTSNYCQFCAILDPSIFKKFRKFSVFKSSSKTNTNTSLHTATWCNFRARTWQSKFTIGENNFWGRIHIYSLICKFKICI